MSLTPLPLSLPSLSGSLTVSQNLSRCRHSLHLTWSASAFCVLNGNGEMYFLYVFRVYITGLHDFLFSIFLHNCVLYNNVLQRDLFKCLFLCVLFFSLSVCVLQVAEMHGELIEFNERLYRSLMAKDHLIVQMRQELIDLRGPVSDPQTHTKTGKHTDAVTHLISLRVFPPLSVNMPFSLLYL